MPRWSTWLRTFAVLVALPSLAGAFSVQEDGAGGLAMLSDDLGSALFGNPALLTAKGSVYRMAVDVRRDLSVTTSNNAFDESGVSPLNGPYRIAYADQYRARDRQWSGQLAGSVPVVAGLSLAAGWLHQDDVRHYHNTGFNFDSYFPGALFNNSFDSSWDVYTRENRGLVGMGFTAGDFAFGITGSHSVVPSLSLGSSAVTIGALWHLGPVALGFATTTEFLMLRPRKYQEDLLPGITWEFPELGLTLGASGTMRFRWWTYGRGIRGGAIAAATAGARVRLSPSALLSFGADGPVENLFSVEPADYQLHAALNLTFGHWTGGYAYQSLPTTQRIRAQSSNTYEETLRQSAQTFGFGYTSDPVTPLLGGEPTTGPTPHD